MRALCPNACHRLVIVYRTNEKACVGDGTTNCQARPLVSISRARGLPIPLSPHAPPGFQTSCTAQLVSVCTRVCLCACIYARMRASLYTRLCTCLHAYLDTCPQTWLRSCPCIQQKNGHEALHCEGAACVYAHAYTHPCICLCTCVYACPRRCLNPLAFTKNKDCTAKDLFTRLCGCMHGCLCMPAPCSYTRLPPCACCADVRAHIHAEIHADIDAHVYNCPHMFMRVPTHILGTCLYTAAASPSAAIHCCMLGT